MFFGAERRTIRAAGTFPLRRSEPALVAFLVMFGVAGYLLRQHGAMAPVRSAVIAAILAAIWAVIVTWLAIAATRIQPEHDPDDPRFLLQGRVGIVVAAIPLGGEGAIHFDAGSTTHSVRARDIGGGAIPVGEEICIERVEDGLAYVERWSLVEQRL